ncbi:hypothetical protein B0T20DRAFT_484739 [Sordaria brevicollis]|uniref:Uncharacterized protein n=1 Tax=Sordaria brevicollis TaxID=83679 RepID=A0AAE0NV02_SORBR|nr:hypothetical protein B0T20DRAFT_484739 [Sordaria brevicollis]
MAKHHTYKGKGRQVNPANQTTSSNPWKRPTDSTGNVQVNINSNLEFPALAEPQPRKSNGRQGIVANQTTRSNPWKRPTDSTGNTQVNINSNPETPAVAEPQPRKSNGRHRNKSQWTQATGSNPQQSTLHSIDHRVVKTSHGNSETPGQSGSSNAKGSDNGQSVQSTKVGDTSDTPGWGYMTDQGWVQQQFFDTKPGKNYPLPGTIVDLSRPASYFFQEIEIPEMQRPAAYKSLLELASTVLNVGRGLPNRRVFNYNRGKWVSLGTKTPQSVYRMVHRRGFLLSLPPVRSDTPPAELLKIEELYRKKNQRKTYHLMLAAKDCEPKLLLAPSSNEGVLNTTNAIHTDDGCNQDNQRSGLVRLMNIVEIFGAIVNYMKPSIADLTSLAMACKDTARLVSRQFAVWDFSSGDFHFKESYRTGKRGVRMNTLIITPLTKVKAASPQDKPFEQEFTLLAKMIHTMNITMTSYRDLVLDQIPYLNVDLVKLIVRSMPKLESITITRCKQLDFSQLGPLLSTVEYKNKYAEMYPTHKKIRLDFYPYFFEGPTSAPNTFGSFGLTYHKPTFDIPKAVFARIMACWDQAARIGFDLLSESSGVWHFIRRLPGPDPFWAYKAREAVLTWKRDCQVYGPGPDSNRRLWNDLGAAVSGDTNEKIRHEPKERKCRGCATNLPDYLFADLRSLTCWGCRMLAFVTNHEDSHFRDRANRVVEIWLGNSKSWPLQRIPCLCRDQTEEQDALKMARLTDEAWRFELFEFEPGMPRYAQAIHWKTHLSSTKRTRELLWPLTGRTNHREGGPQYDNAYLTTAVFDDAMDEKTEKKFRDHDRSSRRDFWSIYKSDLNLMPDMEPYNRNWQARERAKAVRVAEEKALDCGGYVWP